MHGNLSAAGQAAINPSAECGNDENSTAAYANGHAWAARDYVYGLKGARASYAMMAELAEGEIVPVLPR